MYTLTGAFLSTDLKGRAVYCQFPFDAGEDANKIVRLVKEVYGLKSSSISFIKQLRETILSFEYRGSRFQHLKIDQCIYVFEDEDGSKVILAYYVNDIISGTTNCELRERFFKHLPQSWEIEDTSQLELTRVLLIPRNRVHLTVRIHDIPRNIQRVIRRFTSEGILEVYLLGI